MCLTVQKLQIYQGKILLFAKQLFVGLETILETNNLVEYKVGAIGILVQYVVAHAHKLELIFHFGLQKTLFYVGIHNLHGVFVEAKCKVGNAINNVLQKTLQFANFYLYSCVCIHPLDNALYFYTTCVATGLGVGHNGASNFHNFAIVVQHNVVAMDDVGTLQAYVAIGFKTVVLWRWNKRKVGAVDVDFATKWNVTIGHFVGIWIVLNGQNFATIVVCQNNLDWIENCHNAVCVGVQVFSYASVKVALFHFGVGLGNTNALTKVS